jgi:tRNA uridine 5-carbamoylmethylation protein Kti12
MIIELFGPPGVGKTTLAFALVDRLQKRGWDVKSVFSYRPNEDPRARLKDSTRPSAMAAMRRLLRSAIAIEMLSPARGPAPPIETS